METDYLKKCFGNCLAQALAEVATVRPSDPIEYLAHWLYHYRAIAKAKEEVCGVCVCARVCGHLRALGWLLKGSAFLE